MLIVHVALNLLRLAGETLFLVELNRFLGALLLGDRWRTLLQAESKLLSLITIPYFTTRITLPDGTYLHTLIAGVSGTPLILLHGHSMCSTLFAQNIDALVQMGYHIFAPDLPGWGRSSHPIYNRGSTPHTSSINFYTSRIAHWLIALNIRSNFVLCGHSLGAYIAHTLAKDFSIAKKISRLVLVTPAGIQRPLRMAHALWFSLTPQKFLSQGGLFALLLYNLQYPSRKCYNIPGVKELLLSLNLQGVGSGDAAAAAMIRFDKGKAECVKPIMECTQPLKCPVLLLAAQHDSLVEPEHVHQLYVRMKSIGSDVAFTLIADADHSPHISAPKAFANALQKTLLEVQRDDVPAKVTWDPPPEIANAMA